MNEHNITVSIETSPSIPNLKIITITGTIDISTSKRVDERILPEIVKGDAHIIIDLSQLDYLSSTGMMSLTKYHLRSVDNKILLKEFEKPSISIYNMMSFFGLTKKFDMYDSLEAAIKAFR
jgi:anti-sigma B factor antagonist